MMKVQKTMIQPIVVIMQFLKSKTRVQIWLFEQTGTRLEGRIAGFDAYMNVVLDDAEEVNMKTKKRQTLGRILLKGDNITSICAAPQPTTAAVTISATATTTTTVTTSHVVVGGGGGGGATVGAGSGTA